MMGEIKKGRMQEPVRAVLYARCSTEEESQKHALIKQVEEAKCCVQAQGWQLIRVYVESKSGTTIKGRTQFQMLYEELSREDFDVIVIKSQDRLMRNTKDWYLFIDRMQKYGKRLFMYLENRFYTPDDSLITGIKAILAEEYSRELSKKINNAHRTRQREGSRVIITNQTFGYQRTPNKEIEIYGPEAEAVRLIYEMSVMGYGSRVIGEFLEEKGFRRKNGALINETSIRRIIRNPLYMGVAVMNKTHFDFSTKQTLQNPPSQWLYHERAVPAIVDEELWKMANQAMDERMANHCMSVRPKSQFQFSGRIVCGLCQSTYYRTTRKRQRNKDAVIEWKCSRYLYHGRNHDSKIKKNSEIKDHQIGEQGMGCDNIHLEEQRLFRLLEQYVQNQSFLDYSQIVQRVLQQIKKVCCQMKENQHFPDNISRYKKQLQETIAQMDVLMDKLLEGTLSDEAYKRRYQILKEEEELNRTKLETAQRLMENGTDLQVRLHNIEAFLWGEDIRKKLYFTQISEMIEQIEVYPDQLILYLQLSQETGTYNQVSNGQTQADQENPKIQELQENRKNQKNSKNQEIRRNQIVIDLGDLFDSKKLIQHQRTKILQLIQQQPNITAAAIAKELGISRRAAVYRMDTMKKEGILCYRGKGGKGYWEKL